MNTTITGSCYSLQSFGLLQSQLTLFWARTLNSSKDFTYFSAPIWTVLIKLYGKNLKFLNYPKKNEEANFQTSRTSFIPRNTSYTYCLSELLKMDNHEKKYVCCDKWEGKETVVPSYSRRSSKWNNSLANWVFLLLSLIHI